VGPGDQQMLRVGIDGVQLSVLDAAGIQTVYRIAASTTASKDLDVGLQAQQDLFQLLILGRLGLECVHASLACWTGSGHGVADE